MNISIVESIYPDEVHSIVNAAFVAGACAYVKGDELKYYGTQENVNAVKSELAAANLLDICDRVCWLPFSGDISQKIRSRRFGGGEDKRLASEVTASLGSGDLLLYTSLRRSLLELLGNKSFIRKQVPSIFAVEHDLEQILQPMPRRPWLWSKRYQAIFNKKRHVKTKLITLGPSLHHELSRLQRVVPSDVIAINLPRLPTCVTNGGEKDRPLKFLYIGATRKGFRHFYEIAKTASHLEIGNKDNFQLRGFINSEMPSDASDYVSGITHRQVSRAQLDLAISECHFVVWPSDASAYRLRASASFVDAMVVGTPVICIDNPFAGLYFNTHGEAGICVRDHGQLTEVICNLLKSGVPAEYESWRSQCQGIATEFMPDKAMRKIVEAM